MNLKSKITKIHYEKNSKSVLLPILEFFSFFYSKITEFRNYLYDKNILKSYKVNAYVISVGNLTTGGVGKTPLVAEIAKYYYSKNKKVAIISRGYGGKLSNQKVNLISNGTEILHSAQEAGDEPYWFAENLKGINVITCSNRVKAANYAIQNLGVEVIILDDAFQHRKIQRDLNLVLVDSEKLFGNRKHLPAGPLREDFTGLKRADKLVIMNKTAKKVEKNILSNIFLTFDEDKTFVCNLIPGYTYNIKTTEVLPLKTDVTAVCAIGQPEQFYEFVKQKFNIIRTLTFDDHHKYKFDEIAKFKGKIVTTEKDAVKLQNFDLDNIYAMKLKLEIDIEGLIYG
ncbi:tetraacyldisaccharide 4'-kinase [bacterium]|nr:tetraacyldisaccharide 4'-kinase [bacterium]